MDINKLKNKIPDSVLSEIPLVMNRFKINTPFRLAHFLGTCDHESGNFKKVYENLNYSKDRLLDIFPKYFSKGLNESYALQPEKIANRVYASRMGNKNELSGELVTRLDVKE